MYLYQRIIIFFLISTITGLMTSVSSAATTWSDTKHDIMIEQGDEHIFNDVKNKIWIENPKIFSAEASGSKIRLKPLMLGRSKIRLDQKELAVLSVPAGFKNSYQQWQQLVRKSPQLKISFCEQIFCLTGEIFSFQEFEKIQKIMQDKEAFIFLKLTTNIQVQNKIESWYNQYFREHEITPPKIIFSSNPWKAALSSKDNTIMHRNYAHQVGLYTQDNPNKIEISDNIKVSVKFVEIKKNLARKIGLDWQKALAGELINSKLNFDQAIEVTLNAAEMNGDSKTLAEPTIICRNGKEADFFAGGEIPIVFTKYKTREVIWKKYGVSLKIKPVVDPLGQMSIALETEVSTPDLSQAIDGIPGVSVNKVSSHFDLIKSRTIVLSGLLQNGISKSYQGLPYLNKIPFLGKLFSSQNFQNNETELIIFVTPEIFE